VFAGTPEFAATVLRTLLDQDRHRLLAVYTQPDRPAGRGRQRTAGPVKRLAARAGLPVHQPALLRTPEAAAALAALGADALVVAAYGLIIPARVLATTRLGGINVHASLLPRWRGAAPIQRALLAGDALTGVSIMQMTAELDAGPVFAQRVVPIDAQDTAATLHQRLATAGAQLLVQTLDALAGGSARACAQDPHGATYAAKIDKHEALLDWHRPAAELARRVRAFNPAPVARAPLAGETVRIWEAEPVPAAAAGPAGRIVAATRAGIDVATGDGLLRITRLQQPGRRPVSAADYLNAHPELAGAAAAS